MGAPIFAVLGAVGSLMQGMMQANIAKQQAMIQNEQLKIDIENDRIKAAQEENDRVEMFQRAQASNAVASAIAVGGGRNYSFEQGIEPYNKTVAERDVASIQYNKDVMVGRRQYQIAVNKWEARANGQLAMLGGITDAIGGLGDAIPVGAYKSTPGGLLS